MAMDDEIRPARAADVSRMVDLSEQKRVEYSRYQPIFWRKAADSQERQIPYFERLIADQNTIALVYERKQIVEGFIIATLAAAPPVYDPGGPTCMVDDFVVAEAGMWQSIGVRLLEAATAAAKARGAVQTVVVCPHLEQPKRAMLAAAGLTIASEWYVGTL